MVPTTSQPASVLGARILVVDDEPANLKLLRLMLQHAGYTHITLLDDPRETAALYRQTAPDLVLLDLNMPYLNGFEVMAQLREMAPTSLCPVVVLTAQCGQDVLLRALREGANDFLHKPFHRQELLARVHNLLLVELERQRLQRDRSALVHTVLQQSDEVHRLQVDTVHRLAQAAELRDNETGAHVLRMSQTSALLAKEVGWDDHACELLRHASPMHDIGKIGIPDGILLKPGALTPDERAVMQTHTTVGAALLSGSDDELMCMARDIALNHHEKWDGTGYPNGLAGTAIPEPARIVAVADVYDALTSERPYKPAWPVDRAVHFMREQAGKHFDPDILQRFLAVLPQVEAIRMRHAEISTPAVPKGVTHPTPLLPAAGGAL